MFELKQKATTLATSRVAGCVGETVLPPPAAVAAEVALTAPTNCTIVSTGTKAGPPTWDKIADDAQCLDLMGNVRTWCDVRRSICGLRPPDSQDRQGLRGWWRVSAYNGPCPICGKFSDCCFSPARTWMACSHDHGGPGYVYHHAYYKFNSFGIHELNSRVAFFTADERPITVKHFEELQRSCLTEETIKAAGIYTEARPAELAKLLNRADARSRLGPCIVFPYQDYSGRLSSYARLKPDLPWRNVETGKSRKYVAPNVSASEVYFPPGGASFGDDPTLDVLIVDGEKKALCGHQAGFHVITVPGVWNWAKTRGNVPRDLPKKLLTEVQQVNWKGRRVFIALESAAVADPNLKLAELYLCRALKRYGASTFIVHLPVESDKKVGLDDYLLTHSVDDFRTLLGSATEPQDLVPLAGGRESTPNSYERARLQPSQKSGGVSTDISDGENRHGVGGECCPPVLKVTICGNSEHSVRDAVDK